MNGKRSYLGKTRIKTINGSTESHRKTVGLLIDKENASFMAENLLKYINSETDKPLDITIFKNRDNSGLYTTFTYR